MTNTIPPTEAEPKRRRRPDKPYLEPFWCSVWFDRAVEAAKAIDHPMTPEEACKAVAKALDCKPHEAGQVIAAADGVTIRWIGGHWTKL